MAGSAQGGAQPAGQPNVFQQAQMGQTGAMMGTAAGMGYQPAQVQAGQIGQTNLTPYFNPFEQTVVQQSLGDIEQARQMQANQLASQAQRAGAFGGSRSAILESQANEAALQQAARTAANLRLGGFQNSACRPCQPKRGTNRRRPETCGGWSARKPVSAGVWHGKKPTARPCTAGRFATDAEPANLRPGA
jgi:hypothetical protein